MLSVEVTVTCYTVGLLANCSRINLEICDWHVVMDTLTGLQSCLVKFLRLSTEMSVRVCSYVEACPFYIQH